MQPTKGFLIICQGHSMYGEMAYNLAVTIRAAGNTYPICLIHNDSAISHLSETQLTIFNDKIFLDENFIAIRLKLLDLSPYDYTLALDADLLWLNKDPKEIFDVLDTTDFSVENFGYIDTNGDDCSLPFYSHWAKFEDICAAYPIKGKLYMCCNSLILFKKTEVVTKLFAKWKEIHSNPLCKYIEWCQTLPDEFGLNIALNLLNMQPHQAIWHLAKWLDGDTTYFSPAHHAKKYYALNAGGNMKTRKHIDYYNLVAKAAFYKMKLPFMFQLKSKRDYIKERIKM